MSDPLRKFTLTLELELEAYHEDDVRETGHELVAQSGAHYSEMMVEEVDESNPWELAGLSR